MLDEINPSVGDAVKRGTTLAKGLQHRFWETVERTLSEVFDIEANRRLRELRAKVDRATPDTQTAFYHAEPFDVAADLADRIGVAPTAEEKRRYVEYIRKLSSDDLPGEADHGRQHLED